MSRRLTPEALDALLAEHSASGPAPDDASEWVWCAGCDNMSRSVAFPCTIYLLASEVRDARPVIEALRRIEDGVDHPRGMSDQTAGFYEAVNWAQGIARSALAQGV